MHKAFLTLFLACFLSSFSQNEYTAQKKLSAKKYRDFYVQGSHLYGLIKDTLTVWDTLSPKPIKHLTGISTIAPNRNNELCYVKEGKIYNYTLNSVVSADSIKGRVYKLFFDTKNNPVVYSSWGILYQGEYLLAHYNDDTGSVRYSAKAQMHYELLEPQVCYLDEDNRLWLGYDDGEFGGGLLYVDLNTTRFNSPKPLLRIYLDRLKDFTKSERRSFEKLSLKGRYLRGMPDLVKVINNDTVIRFPCDIAAERTKGIIGNKDGGLYVSESMMHFLLSDVNLIKASKSEDEGFYKVESLNEILDKNESGEIAEYLGPVAYNAFNKHAYYYSHLGFFKIIENSKGHFSKELVLKPKILWGGQSNGVGSGMNVKKFEFVADNKFFFLTTNNGIGYFNGSTVKYFY